MRDFTSRSRLFIWLLFGTLLLATGTAQAQTPTFDPSDGATSVPVNKSITVSFDYPLVPESVKIHYPTDTNFINPPTVHLAIKIVADSAPAGTGWNKVAEPGIFTIYDSSFTFEPFTDLALGMEYALTIKGVQVEVPIMTGLDTVTVPDATIYFTVVGDVPKVVTVGFDPEVGIRCTDTNELHLNQVLASHTTGSGPVVTLEKLDSVEKVDDSTFVYHTTSTPLDTWLSAADSSILKYAPAANLIPGQAYQLKVHGSRLNGDANTDLTFPFVSPPGFRMTMSTTNISDPMDTPPAALVFPHGKSFYYNTDSVRVGAVVDDSSYCFVGWSSNIPAFHGLKDSYLVHRFGSDCEAKNIEVTANYRKRDTIIVNVGDTVGFNVVVYDRDFDSIGTTGSYALAPFDRIFVRATPSGVVAGSVKFDSWFSNDIRYNGHESSIVRVVNDRCPSNIVLKPHGPVPAGANYQLCWEADWIVDPGYPVSDVIVNATICGVNQTCAVTATPGQTCAVMMRVKPCYIIAGYSISGPTMNIPWTPVVPPSNMHTIPNLPLTNPKTVVKWFIVPGTNNTLTLETEILNHSEGEIGKDKDVFINVYQIVNGQRIYKGVSPDGTTFSSAVWGFTCDAIVEVEEWHDRREEGFEFDPGWWNNAGYTFPANRKQKTQSFLMNQNRLVRGQFYECDFRFRKIGVYQNNSTSTISWYNVRDVRTGFPATFDVLDLNAFNNPSTGLGTKLHLLFNNPVDGSTVWNTNNLVLTERSVPLDRANWMQYRADNTTNASLASGDKEIVWEPRYASFAPTRPQDLLLSVGGGMKDQSGNYLCNPADIGLEMECVTLTVTFVSARALDCLDYFIWCTDRPDMYNHVGGALVRNGASVVEELVTLPSQTSYPCYEKDMSTPGTRTYNYQLFSAKTTKSDVAVVSAEMWDDDTEHCPKPEREEMSDWLLWIGVSVVGTTGAVLTAFLITLGIIGLILLIGWIVSLFNQTDKVMGAYAWRYDWPNHRFGVPQGQLQSEPEGQDRLGRWKIRMNIR